MKECKKIEEKCSAFLDGELSREEQAVLEAHLAVCPSCETYLKELKEIRRMLLSDCPKVSNELHEKIMGLVMEEAKKNVVLPSKPRRHPPVFTMLAAAVVVVLLATSGTLGEIISCAQGILHPSSGVSEMHSQDAALGESDAEVILGTERLVPASDPFSQESVVAGGETQGNSASDSAIFEKKTEKETNQDKVSVDADAVPASIIEGVYAFCYVAQGKGEVPDFGGTLVAQDEAGKASYFTIKNNMSTLEKVLGVLQNGNYEPQSRQDVGGVTLDNKAEKGLILIVTETE